MMQLFLSLFFVLIFGCYAGEGGVERRPLRRLGSVVNEFNKNNQSILSEEIIKHATPVACQARVKQMAARLADISEGLDLLSKYQNNKELFSAYQNLQRLYDVLGTKYESYLQNIKVKKYTELDFFKQLRQGDQNEMVQELNLFKNIINMLKQLYKDMIVKSNKVGDYDIVIPKNHILFEKLAKQANHRLTQVIKY